MVGMAAGLALAGCQREEPATAEPPSVVDAKFAEWASRLEQAADNPQARHKVLYEVSRDEAVPPFRAMEFLVEHSNGERSEVGFHVPLMQRAKKADPLEAMRCYELIADRPTSGAMFHSLGTELGRTHPGEGLEWLEKMEWSRGVYFAAVNLGKGLGEYAGREGFEAARPVIERFLGSPLYDGLGYGEVKGEGSRMRERLADHILEGLAKAERLTPEVADAMRPMVPEKTRPRVDAYPLLGWPLERLLNDFRPTDFPEASREPATWLAWDRLNEEAPLVDVVGWAERLDDLKFAGRLLEKVYRELLLESDSASVTLAILKLIGNPIAFADAAEVARRKAAKEGNDELVARITALEAQRK